jgi:predicted translin family RNA/ssDNA-binding protein
MRKEKWGKLSPEVKEIIFDLAVRFGHKTYSTIEEIDYKFWEDVASEDIAIALAEKLANLTNTANKMLHVSLMEEALKTESDLLKKVSALQDNLNYTPAITPTKEQMDSVLNNPNIKFEYADTVVIETIPFNKVTKENLAYILNERVYRDEMTKEEEKLAKDNGLVVVFGASDDRIELRGAITDECGKTVFLTKNGEIEHCDEGCKHYERAIDKAKKITGIFGKNGWVFETQIPFAEFDIFDEGQLYGKGIVFDINDLD